MRIPELALAAVAGWSAVGLIGVSVSSRRGDRAKARRGLAWIAAVAIAYLGTLVAVSRTSPQRRLPPGRDECFGTVCYAVIASEEMPAFAGRSPAAVPGERLVRVSVRAVNTAPAGTAARPAIRAYLVDASGHATAPVPGLSGVRLNAPIVAHQPVLSQPVFPIPADATALSLVLTEGHWRPSLLEIGDPDSWMHRPVLLELPRQATRPDL